MIELVNYPKPSDELQKRVDAYIELREAIDDESQELTPELRLKYLTETPALYRALLPRPCNPIILPGYVVVSIDESDPIDPDRGALHIKETFPRYPKVHELLTDPNYVRFQRRKMNNGIRTFKFAEYMDDMVELLTGKTPEEVFEGEGYTQEDVEFEIKLYQAMKEDYQKYPTAIQDLNN